MIVLFTTANKNGLGKYYKDAEKEGKYQTPIPDNVPFPCNLTGKFLIYNFFLIYGYNCYCN